MPSSDPSLPLAGGARARQTARHPAKELGTQAQGALQLLKGRRRSETALGGGMRGDVYFLSLRREHVRRKKGSFRASGWVPQGRRSQRAHVCQAAGRSPRKAEKLATEKGAAQRTRGRTRSVLSPRPDERGRTPSGPGRRICPRGLAPEDLLKHTAQRWDAAGERTT